MKPSPRVQRLRKAAIGTIAVGAVLGGIATAGHALGGPVPTSAGAITYNIPSTHFSDQKPLSVTLGVYPTGGAPSYPEAATVAGSLLARSLTGEEHVHCALTIVTTVVGASDQAGTGSSLRSTAYQTSSIAIAGSFVAKPESVLRLVCTSQGVSDAILENAHVLLVKVASEVNL